MPTSTQHMCPYQYKPCSSVHQGDVEPLDLFFVYASNPPRRVDAIRGAVERIQSDTDLQCKVADWTDLTIEGTVVFCAICEAIRKSRCVVADISGLNFNVLFELGFAIGAGKPIWPLVEQSEKEIHRYAAFETLTTIGHSRYKNSKSIITKLSKKKPWLRQAHLPAPSLMQAKPTRTARQILYLRSPADDEASLRITETLQSSRVDLIIDDPTEVPFQPISWYLASLDSCFAVLMDLGTQDDDDFSLHMAKCALVAGVSASCGRRLLMLANNVDVRPIDYHDLLANYRNAAHAASITTQWVTPITHELRALDEVVRTDITRAPSPDVPLIRKIRVGDYVA